MLQSEIYTFQVAELLPALQTIMEQQNEKITHFISFF